MAETKQEVITQMRINQLHIEIRCWSRDRARQVADKARLMDTSERMEGFLTELLTDALLEFDKTYNESYERYLSALEKTVRELSSSALPPTLTFPKGERHG